MLLAKFGGEKSANPEIDKLVGLFVEGDIITLNRLAAVASLEQKTTVISQLPLEMMAVSFLQQNEGDNTSSFGEKENNSKQPKKIEKVAMKDNGRENRKEEKPKKKDSVDVSEIVSGWGKVLEAVKPMNHSVGALLRACRPAGVEDNCLILEVFYPFHKDRLSDIRNRQIVEDGLKAVFGHDWRLRCVLAQKPAVEPTIKIPSGNKINPKLKTEDELYNIAKDIFGE
jgi:DNA polymerase-3 subunit gamma/tau